ncbi:MAG: glycosyltransferase family 4 protein [Verrucomicrobia bacterium]|nr:glycosyltransferase family 4 protein [Verrucomicrobiota bacterium]
MKIALLKREAQRAGGVEKHVRRIIDAFVERHHQVTLVTPPKLHSFTRTGKLKEFDAYCAEFIQTNPQDVVLGMDRCRHQTHIRAGSGVHAAYLDYRRQEEGLWRGLSFTLSPFHREILDIEKCSLQDSSLKKVIVNSAMVGDEFVSYYNFDRKKIAVLHNGVQFSEMASDFAAWPEKRGKTSRFEFLFVGHNFERKGLHHLLEALSHLNRDDYHLTVVGSDKKQSYFASLAQKKGLPVTFVGHTNPLPYYQQADALVIPSLYDPFANVTVEALAMGLFVITSPRNGGKEVLTEETGIISENKDLSSALSLAMKRPKTWERSVAIRSTVQHLDFSHQLAKLCDLCTS